METHHKIAQSRGGPDDSWNLEELDEYGHAYTHALDFVLFEESPQFDFRMNGWSLLPKDLQEAVKKEKVLRMRVNNPSRDPKVKKKKKETFEKNRTHNFCTPEGRKRNGEKAKERNKVLNQIKCSCLVCHREIQRNNFNVHFRTHL